MLLAKQLIFVGIDDYWDRRLNNGILDVALRRWCDRLSVGTRRQARAEVSCPLDDIA